METTEILKEIEQSGCNRVWIDGKQFNILGCKDGSAFLIDSTTFFAVKDKKNKSVKLGKGEKEGALISYWTRFKDDFLKEKREKDIKKAEGIAMKFLKEFYSNARDHEELVNDNSHHWIVSVAKEISPEFYEQQKDKSRDFLEKFPDSVRFSEKLLEYANNGKLDEAYANLVNYLTNKPPAIGIFKYHNNNIGKFLQPYMELKKKVDETLFSGTNESDDLDYLLACEQALLKEAMLYVFNNAKHNYKTLEDFEAQMETQFVCDLIEKCYYGNVLCAVIEPNRISYSGKIVNIDRSLFETGTKAYRMQVEKIEVGFGYQSNGIYTELEHETYTKDEVGAIVSC